MSKLTKVPMAMDPQASDVAPAPTPFDLAELELPPANTKRWGIRRKAAVVAAVSANILSVDEACRIYSLSQEEFSSWRARVERHGVAGLRVTRLCDYRRKERAEANSDLAPVEP